MSLATQLREKSRIVKERSEITELVTLPSGAQVKLRPVALETFILRGQRLPQSLTSKVAKLNSKATPDQLAAQLSESEIVFGISFMRSVVMEAVAEPRLVDVVENPDEEVALTEISNEDYTFIFQYATGQNDAARATEEGATVGAVSGFRRSKQRKPSAKPGARRR